MNNSVRVAAAMVVIGGILVCASSPAAGGRIGYVDIERVFEKYQKTIDLNAKLQEDRTGKIAKRRAMVEGINKLKDEADLLRDEAKKKKETAVDEKVKALYQFEEKVKREAMQKQARLQEEILGEMRAALAEIGKNEGYDIILAVTGDDIGYRSERLDVTDQVTKVLNKKYAEGKK